MSSTCHTTATAVPGSGRTQRASILKSRDARCGTRPVDAVAIEHRIDQNSQTPRVGRTVPWRPTRHRSLGHECWMTDRFPASRRLNRANRAEKYGGRRCTITWECMPIHCPRESRTGGTRFACVRACWRRELLANKIRPSRVGKKVAGYVAVEPLHLGGSPPRSRQLRVLGSPLPTPARPEAVQFDGFHKLFCLVWKMLLSSPCNSTSTPLRRTLISGQRCRCQPRR